MIGADESNLNKLLTALEKSEQYPNNDCGIDAQDHVLDALREQLMDRANDLFCSGGQAEPADLNFLEMYQSEGYTSSPIPSPALLETILQKPLKQHRPDPMQRYIFISAPHSRARLSITRHMMLHILTYHQVMPTFLNLVFPFGKQHYVRQPFGGFRSNTRHISPCRDQVIHSLDRYGRHVELCYNLKGVERFKASTKAPAVWMIRQCSIYHRFDLVSHKSTWIVIKANRKVHDAIQKRLERDHRQETPPVHSFTTALIVHKIICEWADANWDWHINDLESSLQHKTRRTLVQRVEQDSMASRSPPPQTVSWQPQSPSKQTRRTWSISSSVGRAISRATSFATRKDDMTIVNDRAAVETFSMRPLETESAVPVESYRFEDLQEVQRFEDKMNMALLTLKVNSNVVQNLAREYERLARTTDFKQHSLDTQSEQVAAFQERLLSIDENMTMHQTRLETLLKMAADRKSLIQGILSYRNMQATRQLAEEAQKNAERMEIITHHMHDMTQRNLVEAVSMRIITVVTLIFLPGTFISVSCALMFGVGQLIDLLQTLMSTPMVVFEQQTTDFSFSNIGVGALKLYLVVSVPLMVLTILVWYGYYLRVKGNAIVSRASDCDPEKGFRPDGTGL